jgi:hypothetical protein
MIRFMTLTISKLDPYSTGSGNSSVPWGGPDSTQLEKRVAASGNGMSFSFYVI